MDKNTNDVSCAGENNAGTSQAVPISNPENCKKKKPRKNWATLIEPVKSGRERKPVKRLEYDPNEKRKIIEKRKTTEKRIMLERPVPRLIRGTTNKRAMKRKYYEGAGDDVERINFAENNAEETSPKEDNESVQENDSDVATKNEDDSVATENEDDSEPVAGGSSSEKATLPLVKRKKKKRIFSRIKSHTLHRTDEPAVKATKSRLHKSRKVYVANTAQGEAKERVRSDARSLRAVPCYNYLALSERKAQNVSPQPQHDAKNFRATWKLKEKKALVTALQNHNHDDFEDIQRYIPTKSVEEVRAYIKYLSTRRVELPSTDTPSFVAPIELWTNTCIDLARDHEDDYSRHISQMMSLCGEMAEAGQAASATAMTSTSESEQRPKYSLIYQYLSDVLDRKPATQLDSFEAAILVDLLQTLGNTMRTGDVSEQAATMKRKYRGLTSEPKGVREAIGLRDDDNCAENTGAGNTPGPHASSAIADNSPTLKKYNAASFMWMDHFERIPKMLRRGRPTIAETEQMQKEVHSYQNAMQTFTLNPFGVPQSILKLKHARLTQGK